MIGVGLIIFSLCLQATLGNVQQYVLKTFNADYRENVFYSVRYLKINFLASIEFTIFFFNDR